MVGKTNVCGGGGKLFAIIAVTYPSGSICTCGGKKAKDTSGKALFNVKAGTYTVECHTSDNSKSKSTSVTVSTSDKGKSKSVTLSYELYIFKSGSGLAPGYEFKNVESSSSSSNSLIANTSGDYSNGSSFYITPNINFDGYSRLNFDLVGYKYTGPYDPNPNVRYGCSSNTTVTGHNGVPAASNYTASSTSLPTTRQTVSIDISSISNNQYIKVETLDARLVIYNIWLS